MSVIGTDLACFDTTGYIQLNTLMQMSNFEDVALSILSIYGLQLPDSWVHLTHQPIFFRHSIVNNFELEWTQNLCHSPFSTLCFLSNPKLARLAAPSSRHHICFAKYFVTVCFSLFRLLVLMLLKPLKLCIALYFYEHTGGCWLKVPLAKYSVQLPSVCTLTGKKL